MSLDQSTTEELKNYFTQREDIVLAYLFGSQAKGTASPMRSDADIAVYFVPKTGVFEYEENEWGVVDYSYEAEPIIQSELEKITGKDVDLIVLNRAPAYLVASVLKTGIMLKESSRRIFLELWCRSLSDEADYSAFFREYNEIMKRSQSISVEDRNQLAKIIPFLREELQHLREMGSINQIAYMQDWKSRNIIERSIEKTTNAGLDIAKILLASHYKHVPDKYADMMVALGGIGDFDETRARWFADVAKLRNFIAHEYLDYRWKRIRNFVDHAQGNFTYLIEFTERLLREEERLAVP